MKLNSLFFVAAALLAAVSGARAEFDRAELYKHLPKALPFPPGVEFKLRDLHPSALPGFLTGTLDASYKGHPQSWTIQISEDGHYYILSEVFPLGPSKVPGFLAPQGGADAPTVQFAKNGKVALVGEFQDLSVDPDKANLAKARIKDVPFRGTAGAPLVMVEYSDLECPFCREAHMSLDKELLAAYGKKLRWIFKHNPLPMHKWAYSAAIASACGSKQKPDIGWKLEGSFFEHQATPETANDPSKIKPEIEPAAFRAKAIELAKSAGADEAKFTACFDQQESKPAVDADMQEAKSLGLNSTPAFLINGRIVHGFRNFELLKESLDAMLAEKGSN